MAAPSQAERRLEQQVIASFARCPDPRLRRVLQSLVKHLHAFVREVELTEEEWMTGIRFLTEAGKTCDDVRQEFILLSDTLGVSMLVDAINHRKPKDATEATVLGPFYVPGSKQLPMWADIAAGLPGVPAYVHGRVLDVNDQPVAGAELDVWQNDSEGFYDVQRAGASYARGKFSTDAQGRYGFRTTRPVSYPIPTDGPVGSNAARHGPPSLSSRACARQGVRARLRPHHHARVRAGRPLPRFGCRVRRQGFAGRGVRGSISRPDAGWQDVGPAFQRGRIRFPPGACRHEALRAGTRFTDRIADHTSNASASRRSATPARLSGTPAPHRSPASGR